MLMREMQHMFQRYDDLDKPEEEKPKRQPSGSNEPEDSQGDSKTATAVSHLIKLFGVEPEKPKRQDSTHPIEGFGFGSEKPKRTISSHPIEGMSFSSESASRSRISRERLDPAYLEKAFVLNKASWNFLRGKSQWIPGNGGLVLVFFGLFFLLILGPFALNDITSANERNSSGRIATATITNRRISRGKSTSYYLSYQFTTHTERTIQREEGVNSSLYNQSPVGTALQVVYAENNPTNARLVLNSKNDLWIGMLVGGLFILPMVIGGLMMYQRVRRLNRHGMLLPGQLVSCKGSSGKNGYTVTARYQFRTPEGPYLTGSSSSQRSDLRRTALPQNGTPVIVVWDGRKLHRML